ncbi:drug/metabolite transporter (DMT)-like permease [Amycolatopsis bartoniae]|uniref:Transporter n=1 Tax=Amycolatopsis bartoniae TaxID=941986 RepID=A0A8H9MA83_9PSEU|nr:DMT family transporter [Amycolatopsis bartoniae]MBB2934492.1 drug/metabolite transporter (DMT)-like permease [Amycolatopsis bartoniae]TVT01871.1 DMT family transporter [Amycolatopsis bartoniae]GHF47010.1 transporter [Amycolatopsis bartoniae]
MAGRVGVQFCLLALAWGASFLFIKIGLEGLSPAQVVWSRMVFGALALVLVMLVRRAAVPREPALWGHLAVVSVLLCVVPFLLFSWAEQHISSGLASIYNGTTPLTTMAFAAAVLPTEKNTRDRGAGLVLGFLGVLLVIGPWSVSGHGDLLPQVACLGATTCYGLAFAYLRRFVSPRGVPAPTVAFVQVTVGAVLMLLATPFLAGGEIDLTWPVALSMLALGAVCTGLAYIWNTNIVGAWGAPNAAAVTYVTPIVGVVLGIVVLGEPLAWHQPAGAALVIVGILAAHGRLRVARSSTAPRHR